MFRTSTDQDGWLWCSKWLASCIYNPINYARNLTRSFPLLLTQIRLVTWRRLTFLNCMLFDKKTTPEYTNTYKTHYLSGQNVLYCAHLILHSLVHWAEGYIVAPKIEASFVLQAVLCILIAKTETIWADGYTVYTYSVNGGNIQIFIEHRKAKVYDVSCKGKYLFFNVLTPKTETSFELKAIAALVCSGIVAPPPLTQEDPTLLLQRSKRYNLWPMIIRF